MTRERMAADIKATRTSRVTDEVAIVDELSDANPAYRQYCELMGTAQTTGGVIAPYSRREVAYYEISCYRIENRGQGDVETLVAHETSIDPFFFTDESCDTPVYVDLASFGDNVILVNSTNHIEGPTSDFARAADAAGGRSAGTAGVTAIVGRAARGVRMLGGSAAQSAREFYGLVARALAHACAFLLGALGWGGGFALALAPAGTVAVRPALGGGRRGPTLLQAGGRGPGGRGPGAASGPGGRAGRSSGPRPHPMPGPAPSRQPMPIPPGMGRFLGGLGGPGYSVAPRPPRPSRHTGDLLTGMALGTLLGTLANGGGTQASTTATFRGYRLVEDVVPLGSPVYCIGELYRTGERHTMGRSLSADYPTSYFAARPEAEVLSRLGC